MIEIQERNGCLRRVSKLKQYLSFGNLLMTGFLRKEELHSSLELFLFRAPLLNKIDCRLGDLVERRQGLGIRLVVAFC